MQRSSQPSCSSVLPRTRQPCRCPFSPCLRTHVRNVAVHSADHDPDSLQDVLNKQLAVVRQLSAKVRQLSADLKEGRHEERRDQAALMNTVGMLTESLLGPRIEQRLGSTFNSQSLLICRIADLVAVTAGRFNRSLYNDKSWSDSITQAGSLRLATHILTENALEHLLRSLVQRLETVPDTCPDPPLLQLRNLARQHPLFVEADTSPGPDVVPPASPAWGLVPLLTFIKGWTQKGHQGPAAASVYDAAAPAALPAAAPVGAPPWSSATYNHRNAGLIIDALQPDQVRLKRLLTSAQAYMCASSRDEQLELLQDQSGMGLMLVDYLTFRPVYDSMQLKRYKDLRLPRSAVALDCIGRAQVRGQTWRLELAELKSASLGKATQQLAWRLDLAEYVARHALYPSLQSYEKVGYIILPRGGGVAAPPKAGPFKLFERHVLTL